VAYRYGVHAGGGGPWADGPESARFVRKWVGEFEIVEGATAEITGE
jgi:hypothetical protein